MTEEKISISELIRINVAKAKEIIDSKSKSISILNDALQEINNAIGGKLSFEYSDVIDDDGDKITNISVSNIKSGYKEHLMWYYFHPENIFPAVFNYQGIINARCDSVEDVLGFVQRIVSNDSFMIKLVRISEMDNYKMFDDDIPF